MKTTEQLNAEFTAATPEGKRILIAEDVLSQLAAKRFLPTQGNWVTIRARGAEPSAQVCDIETSEKNCSCCLLGAMMMSEVRINNHLTLGELPVDFEGTRAMYFDRANGFGDAPRHGNRLAKYFSAEQLRLIELAYERGNGFYDADRESVTDREAVEFDFRSKYPDDRMRHIMENVIANNGTFIP